MKALFTEKAGTAPAPQKNSTETIIALPPKQAATNFATPEVVQLQNQALALQASLNQEKEQQNTTLAQIQALSRNIDQLSIQLQNTTTQIARLENSFNTISKTTNKINNDVNSMDSRVLGLSNIVNALSTDLGNVKQALNDDGIDVLAPIMPLPPLPLEANNSSDDFKSAKKVNKKNKNSEPLTYDTPDYVVHAVIPGRAWLKPKKGNIITVTEGESVGDYGKVLTIDAANGMVLMSSGISFR